jgi:hypothetical protein
MAAPALNWKAVLLFLAFLTAFQTIYVVNKDMANQGHREQASGMMPTRSHVHLKHKKTTAHSKLHLPGHREIIGNAVAEDTDHESNDSSSSTGSNTKDEPSEAEADDGVHKVAGLKCDAYGGPSEEDAAEMVYWQDIEMDAKFVSPLKASGPKTKYLTFEPDEGEYLLKKHMKKETRQLIACDMF